MMEISSCLPLICSLQLGADSRCQLRFYGKDNGVAGCACRHCPSVVATAYSAASCCRRASSGSATRMAAAAVPPAIIPLMIASAMLPPPMKPPFVRCCQGTVFPWHPSVKIRKTLTSPAIYTYFYNFFQNIFTTCMQRRYGMSKVLIIGAGGVGQVVPTNVPSAGIFSAKSRWPPGHKSKCDAIAAQIATPA